MSVSTIADRPMTVCDVIEHLQESLSETIVVTSKAQTYHWNVTGMAFVHKEKAMIRDAYAVVMDDEQNAFARLPKITRFQIMTVLSLMWSVVFTSYIGSYIVFGPTVLAHIVVLLAIFFTADVFRRAERETNHHRDAMRNKQDGTGMYDDIWGAS